MPWVAPFTERIWPLTARGLGRRIGSETNLGYEHFLPGRRAEPRRRVAGGGGSAAWRSWGRGGLSAGGYGTLIG